MAPTMFSSPPCFHTGSLGARYTVVGDWQVFTRLCGRLGSQQHGFYERSS